MRAEVPRGLVATTAAAGWESGRDVAVIAGCHAIGLAFALIGFFLWLGENIATYVGAWRYPYQLHGWQPVGLDKFGAWALLISVTVVMVAATRRRRDRDGAADGDDRAGHEGGKGREDVIR